MKGFPIFIIHPGEVNEEAQDIVRSKPNIDAHVRASIQDIILDIMDFRTIPGIGGHYASSIQTEAIDREIKKAKFIIIIVGESAGKADGFQYEISQINKLKLPFVCFCPEKSTEGKKYIYNNLKYDQNKVFINEYSSKKHLSSIASGIIGAAIIREIKKQSKEDTYKTRYLNYDPSFLINSYENEVELIVDYVPYSEKIRWLQNTLDKTKYAVKKIKLTKSKDFILNNDEKTFLEHFRTQAYTDFDEYIGVNGNSEIIRLNSADFAPDTLKSTLEIQKARYIDQIRSNLVMDWKGSSALSKHHVSLRDYLNAKYPKKLPPLNSGLLANTIGISVILFYKSNNIYRAHFPKRSGETSNKQKRLAVYNQGEYASFASSVAHWNNDANNFEQLFIEDMYKTIQRDMGIERKQIEVMLPLALCREFLRGGKPQIFFGGIFKNPIDQETLERKGKKAMNVAKQAMQKVKTDDASKSLELSEPFEIWENDLTLEARVGLYYARAFLKVYKESQAERT